MPAMIDLECAGCGHLYGYCGEPIDRVPCPRCGTEPDAKDARHDQKIVDEFREFVREWKDRGKLVKAGRQRVAAGLSLRQAAKKLGVEPRLLCDIENGRAEASDELTRRMAECYGLS